MFFFVGMKTPAELAADPVASLSNPGGALLPRPLALAAAASFSDSVIILSVSFLTVAVSSALDVVSVAMVWGVGLLFVRGL